MRTKKDKAAGAAAVSWAAPELPVIGSEIRPGVYAPGAGDNGIPVGSNHSPSGQAGEPVYLKTAAGWELQAS